MKRIAREKTMSIRLLWPFLRAVESRMDLGPLAPDLVDPDTRLAASTVTAMLQGAVQATGDPALGLRAAALAEPGDIDVLEYAARGCSNLGEAYACMVRYFRLLNEAGSLLLQVDEREAALVYRAPEGDGAPPASIDYALFGLVHFTRRNADWDESGAEMQLSFSRPAYADEYARVFSGRIRFGARRNALVMPARRLTTPMSHANRHLAAAFELRARQLASKLSVRDSTASTVRELVGQHLGSGKVSMSWTAEKVGMSVPTLRRHLEAEQTSFKRILEAVRRDIAEQELGRRDTSVSELAFALGFSNVSAFDRAFKRWTGMSPTTFRDRS